MSVSYFLKIQKKTESKENRIKQPLRFSTSQNNYYYYYYYDYCTKRASENKERERENLYHIKVFVSACERVEHASAIEQARPVVLAQLPRYLPMSIRHIDLCFFFFGNLYKELRFVIRSMLKKNPKRLLNVQFSNISFYLLRA